MESVNDAVSRYWSRVAEGFNERASHVRHHDMWQRVIAAALGTGRDQDVLDLGTGTGACAILAAGLGHRVTAVDGSEGMLRVARQQAEARNLDISFHLTQIEEMDVALGTFDVVTLRNILWTVEDPKGVLAAVRSRLREGGTLFVTDGEWNRADSRSDYDEHTASRLPHHAGLSALTMKKLLIECGFMEIRDLTLLFDSHPYEAMGYPPYFAFAATRADRAFGC